MVPDITQCIYMLRVVRIYINIDGSIFSHYLGIWYNQSICYINILYNIYVYMTLIK